MRFPNIFSSKKIEGKIGYLSAKNESEESFKGEVRDIPITFPKELGAEHPFYFEDMEKIYESIGVITGGINKITDSVVGDFSFKTKTKKAELIVNDFIKNTKFTSVLREWIREGFVKGNGFLELDIIKKQIKVNNANNMYVKRNDKANIVGYNQWVGDLNRFSRTNSKLVSFKPNEIAHLKINTIAGKPYGIGIIYQNERAIENMVLNEQDLHKLISRKAGAPIHVKVGQDGERINPSDVDDVKNSLKVMNNRTEWVTDSNVKMDVLDFGNIGKSLTDTLDHDMLVIAYGMEIPIVLFGGGNIPEGLAKAQTEIFNRKMSVIQEEIESIIEEQIFKPLLKQNNIDDEVQFTWNIPGIEDINNRIDVLTKITASMTTSEPLRRMCEIEIAKLLDLDDGVQYLSKPEKEKPEDEEPEKPKPDDPEPKPKDETKNAFEIQINESELEDVKSGEISLKEFTNLKETKKLKYSDYLANILKQLKIDKFEFLAAFKKSDIADGKLSTSEIEKLRIILESGFKENQTIVEIKSEIKKLKLKDVKKDGKVILQSALRPNIIARTETVRLANLGLISTYKGAGIKKVEWLAAASERTCDICNALHGQVFDINTVSPPPAHPMCRCSLLSILTDVKK